MYTIFAAVCPGVNIITCNFDNDLLARPGPKARLSHQEKLRPITHILYRDRTRSPLAHKTGPPTVLGPGPLPAE